MIKNATIMPINDTTKSNTDIPNMRDFLRLLIYLTIIFIKIKYIYKMTTRQVLGELIKAIRNDDKVKINKLRKEYSKTGYTLSDRDMKNLHKKHSKTMKKSAGKSQMRKSMKRKSPKKSVRRH